MDERTGRRAPKLLLPMMKTRFRPSRCASAPCRRLTFTKLSSDRLYHIPMKPTIDGIRRAVADTLLTQYWFVDVVDMDNYFIYDPEMSTEGLKNPFEVMIQPEERVVPLHLVSSKPDITWEEEFDDRIEMSCGHAITPSNLYTFCRKEIMQSKTEIKCFGKVDGDCICNQVWDLNDVLCKSMLSVDERLFFEAKISFNYINKCTSENINCCPGCGIFCEMIDESNSHVQCFECTKERGYTYKFCWKCLKAWFPGHECTDEDEDIIDLEIQRQLRLCSTKTVGYSNMGNVPSMRLCPNCKCMLAHNQACKSMLCQFCNTEFCFACLGIAVNGKLPCGEFNRKCIVAPVQEIH